MMQSNKLTVDETHSHGALSEIIFLLRAFENRIRILENLLRVTNEQLQRATAFNRYYYNLYVAAKRKED